MGSKPRTDLTQLESYAELQDFLDRRREEPDSFEEFELELEKRMRALRRDKGVASPGGVRKRPANLPRLEDSNGSAPHDRPDRAWEPR